MKSPSRPLRIESLEQRRLLAQLTVNSLLDDTPVGDGLVTLREAIQAANDDETTDLGQTGLGADVIEFAPALFASGPQNLPLSSGALRITDDLLVTGPGAGTLTISGSGASRVAEIDDGNTANHANVELRDLTLTNGVASGTGDAGNGGAIYSQESLTLTRMTITGSAAAASGGGVYARVGTGGVLVATDVLLGGNVAQLRGGGAMFTAANSGAVAVSRVDVANNTAGSDGGGLSFEANDNGTINILEANVNGNGAPRGGGMHASLDAGGQITIANSALTGNTATGNGTGDADYVALGGGLRAELLSSGYLTLANSQISGNFGGGLAVRAANASSLAVLDSKLVENVPHGLLNFGGGGASLELADGSLATIQRSLVSGNVARGASGAFGAVGGGGAGIFASAVHNSTLSFIDSTLADNTSTGNGGGLYAELYQGSALTLVNSTVSGNRADFSGGGVYVNSADNAQIRHSTITLNTSDAANAGKGDGGGGVQAYAGQLQLDHAIIAANTDNSGQAPDLAGRASAAWSLIGTNLGATLTLLGTGNKVGTPASELNPLLKPLENNGGATPTHALLPSSPALDAGAPDATPGTAGVPSFDQRGAAFARVLDGDGNGTVRIDMGALEAALGTNADFDADSDVDGFDFLAWQRGFGQASGALPSKGDADSDGDVDANDLAAWDAAFGQLAGIAQALAPSPAWRPDLLPGRRTGMTRRLGLVST